MTTNKNISGIKKKNNGKATRTFCSISDGCECICRYMCNTYTCMCLYVNVYADICVYNVIYLKETVFFCQMDFYVYLTIDI